MAMSLLQAGLFAAIVAVSVAGDASKYKTLHDRLIKKFTLALPMGSDNKPVKVDLKITLRNILNVNKECNIVTLIAWKEESWVDPALAWNLTEYPIKSVGIRANNLWYPDTIPYNLVSKNEFLTPPTVVVLHTGKVVSVQAMKFSIDCPTGGYDTYSGATCTLKMGSWTYNGDLLSFKNPTEKSFNVDEFSRYSKFEIMPDHPCSKTVHHYPCCNEPYETMSFTFHFRLKGNKSLKFKHN